MADVSTFTLTFVVEVRGLEVWHDCVEGWLDLGPPVHGLKLSYSLYPGHIYDLDVLIWPHVAKVWCQGSYGWVRTWLRSERRWLAFSLRHALRVNTAALRDHVISLTVSDGLIALSLLARNDRNDEVYCPQPAKLEPPEFAEVIDDQATRSMITFIRELVWDLVRDHIPVSHLDGQFDVPQRVTDLRHQNAVMREVNAALEEAKAPSSESSLHNLPSKLNGKSKQKSNKELKPPAKGQTKQHSFEIRFTGDAVLAGVSRVVSGVGSGARGAEQGAVAVLLSTCNVPAHAQQPVFFVNALKLEDMPVKALLMAGFSHVYTRWKACGEEHCSAPRAVASAITLRDPRAVPLEPARAAHAVASFQERPLEVEIRALRNPAATVKNALIFGSSPDDDTFGHAPAPRRPLTKETDVLVAVCRVDLQTLAHGNGVVSGSFPVFPPPSRLQDLPKDPACTNEINAIRMAPILEPVIPNSAILDTTPTLTMSIGYIGCRPAPLPNSYGRLLCFPMDSETTASILSKIYQCNEESDRKEHLEELLTGWAVDMGASAIIYVEGPCFGHILTVLGQALQIESSNVSFSSAARYPIRLYAEALNTPTPFVVVKLHAPLSALLACPPLYVRPALPPPTRSATLKLGRLSMCGAGEVGLAEALPTAAELRSLALELAAPRRPSVGCGELGARVSSTE